MTHGAAQGLRVRAGIAWLGHWETREFLASNGGVLSGSWSRRMEEGGAPLAALPLRVMARKSLLQTVTSKFYNLPSVVKSALGSALKDCPWVILDALPAGAANVVCATLKAMLLSVAWTLATEWLLPKLWRGLIAFAIPRARRHFAPSRTRRRITQRRRLPQRARSRGRTSAHT